MNARSITTLLTVVAAVVFCGGPGAHAQTGDGAEVGKWKTWVLASGSEIAVPAPPAENSDQAKAEVAELRLLQLFRSPITNAAIQAWNSGPATQRWTELVLALNRQERVNNSRAMRSIAAVHTAMHDAVVAAYNAKFVHNRKAPNQVAPDLIPTAAVGTAPSYPSEHAAIAAAAAGTLAYFFPKETQNLAALVQEAGSTRLLAGTNFRSDIDAGVALGQAVAEKAIARAKTDNSDLAFSGTIPTGPGYWTVPTGATPVEPTMGQWKPWLLTSGSQFRPAAPPAFGSPEFNAALAEVKRINQSVTPTERAIATQWAGNVHLFWETAYLLIRANQLSTPRAARALALMGAVSLDSIIASHDAKFTYYLLRPQQADPTIVPLFNDPAHPSYTSNGTAIWAAQSEVLAYFFPQDAARLRFMGQEAGYSRLNAGIHYRFDVEAGAGLGQRVSALAIERDKLSQ